MTKLTKDLQTAHKRETDRLINRFRINVIEEKPFAEFFGNGGGLCLQPRVIKNLFANLDRIWSINWNFVFSAVRVFDFEFVIFVRVNQDSMRIVVRKIR